MKCKNCKFFDRVPREPWDYGWCVINLPPHIQETVNFKSTKINEDFGCDLGKDQDK